VVVTGPVDGAASGMDARRPAVWWRGGRAGGGAVRGRGS